MLSVENIVNLNIQPNRRWLGQIYHIGNRKNGKECKIKLVGARPNCLCYYNTLQRRHGIVNRKPSFFFFAVDKVCLLSRSVSLAYTGAVVHK
ncbi:Os08g0503400 [Oryza sativa Japonica Group]|uniref:Os08g0503400 protein n=1 Tax=Oryza sativa subsp. japonica TaxID=39947 RepID=A0A0P0XHU0_ORYSJ|nr:hypothetical protein EE612_045202 [Oryza sativa]BAT06137.1 Os08g0503400 [Oryza sativa Japonica Group]